MGSPTKTTWTRRDNRDLKLRKRRNKRVRAAVRKVVKKSSGK